MDKLNYPYGESDFHIYEPARSEIKEENRRDNHYQKHQKIKKKMKNLDWNPFNWFHNTKCTSAKDVAFVTPFGHFKNGNQFWNFCHNKWQLLSGTYYKYNLIDFRYFTTKLLDLGGILEYKEHHNNGIYEMFIKPNCYNTVNVVYFEKGNNNMNANKRLQKDENKLNKAQSTIKSVKHDIKQIRNHKKHSKKYLVLALYDCLDNDTQEIADDFYVVQRGCNSGYVVSPPKTYKSVLNSAKCWFDKGTARELYDKLFYNGSSCCSPKVLSRHEFEEEYGKNE